MKDIEYFRGYLEEHGDYEVFPEIEYRRVFESCGLLQEKRGAAVLDAGCGSGAFSFQLYAQDFSDITAVDLSSDLIAKAQNKATAARASIKFQTGDILRLPFPDGSFDVVFCGVILHHVPAQIKEAGLEFHRVLRPGGRVYMFEPHSGCLNSFIRYRLLNVNRTEDERALDPDRVRAAFEAAQFVDCRVALLQKMKILYPLADAKPAAKVSMLLRKTLQETLFPNLFFSMSCRRI